MSHDLAILGRVSRERPIPVENTLQHVGAIAAPARSRAAASARDQIAMLPFARIYALRVARIWAGATMLVVTLAIVVLAMAPRSFDEPSPQGAFYEIFYVNPLWLVVCAMVPVLAVYSTVTSMAMRRFQRAVSLAAEPLRRARGSIDRIARASVAVPMLGLQVMCLFFGLLYITIGHWNVLAIFEPIDAPDAATAVHWELVLTAAASCASAVAAFAMSRWRSVSGTWIALGFFVVFATATVGMRYDIGPLERMMLSSYHPSYVLRAVLTVAGTLGLLAIIGCTLIRRRAGEDRELDASSE